MELKQIKYFIEVARKEHVTSAAEKLHVAQSAISRQIANLEDELGVELFYREGRNVKLTSFGKIFLQRVESALVEIDKAIQEVNEFLDPESGEIRIGFPNSLAAYTLPTVVSSFRNKYPNVRFQLPQDTVLNLIENVIKGNIDLAFVSPVPLDHPDVDGHVLFEEEMMALLPPDHPLSTHEKIDLAQLSEDQFVMFRSGFTMRKLVHEACQQAGFEPNISFEGEETDTIRGLVSAGLGVALLPAVALTEGSTDGGPTIVRIREPKVTRTVGFVVPRNRKLAPTGKLFQEFLFDMSSYYRQQQEMKQSATTANATKEKPD